MKQFRDTCDTISICKEAPMWLKYYFMEKPASPSLEGCLLSKKTRASDLHPEILSSYFEVVHYLFVAYATDNIIDHLIKKLDCY